MDGAVPSGATSARTSATLIVYCVRSSDRQSGSYTCSLTTVFLNDPYGNAFTVYTYISLSARNLLSVSRTRESCATISAELADSRRQTPNDSLGATRALTWGTYVVRLVQICSHVSPGWTSVE